MKSPIDQEKTLAIFEGKHIRRISYEGQWYFSVIDVVRVLTDSSDAKDYWYRLKQREQESSGIQLSTFCRQLKLPAEDEKLRETDCASTESLLRIIQSVPSKKAEPFKRWLAMVGYERMEEIQNPELAQERMKEIYKARGYPNDWIEKRVRGIAIRQELTDEWKKRGVQKGKEYAILTNEISKATFGKTVEEYKRFKGLEQENLRDHMDDLEIIFTMLGERVTTEITKSEDAKGFKGCNEAAKEGGEVAGNARKETEKRIGRPVVSGENYLIGPKKKLKQIR